jgi:hypothetical protein
VRLVTAMVEFDCAMTGSDVVIVVVIASDSRVEGSVVKTERRWGYSLIRLQVAKSVIEHGWHDHDLGSATIARRASFPKSRGSHVRRDTITYADAMATKQSQGCLLGVFMRLSLEAVGTCRLSILRTVRVTRYLFGVFLRMRAQAVDTC